MVSPTISNLSFSIILKLVNLFCNKSKPVFCTSQIQSAPAEFYPLEVIYLFRGSGLP